MIKNTKNNFIKMSKTNCSHEAIRMHKSLLLNKQQNRSINKSTTLTNLKNITFNEINNEFIINEALDLILNDNSDNGVDQNTIHEILKNLHKPYIDVRYRNDLIINILQYMINNNINLNKQMVKLLWSKKFHSIDNKFTLNLWQMLRNMNYKPNFLILHEGMKVSARRLNVNECTVYFDKIKQLPHLTLGQLRVAEATFISCLEADPIRAEAYYRSLPPNLKSTKAKVSLLSVVASKKVWSIDKLINTLKEVEEEEKFDDVKIVCYAAVMRGLAKVKEHKKVIEVFEVFKRKKYNYDRYYLGILKPPIQALSYLNHWNTVIKILNDHHHLFNGRPNLIHPLLNELTMQGEKYGVWWVWKNLANWNVKPNSKTFNLVIKAGFNNIPNKFVNNHPCDYFIVENYCNQSFRHHLNELSKGLKYEFKRMYTNNDNELIHSSQYWILIDGIFKTVLFNSQPSLKEIKNPLKKGNNENSVFNNLIKRYQQPPKEYNNSNNETFLNFTINDEHFNNYIKLLYENRKANPTYTLNQIMISMNMMKNLSMKPTKSTIIRSIIILNESISPMFLSDVKRMLNTNNKELPHQTQFNLFGLDDLNKNENLESFYTWLRTWINEDEIPNDKHIFLFWLIESKRFENY